MILPISIAEKLTALQNGEKIPFSKLKHSVVESMIDNGILKKQIQGRSKTLIYLSNKNSLPDYLKNHFGIDNLENYIIAFKKEDLSRGEAVEVSSNSKLKSIRTFKGFLVNCFQPVECKLNGKQITIEPQEGTFTFIYDYDSFTPSDNITIVGIENPENFRHIQKQKKLFENIQPLFVSRYPQSKDLIKWLKTIPNNYLHFGDFDFSGIGIYLNEFKKHIAERTTFFIPENIDKLIADFGNKKRYDEQKINFKIKSIQQEKFLRLIDIIHKYRKGLEIGRAHV